MFIKNISLKFCILVVSLSSFGSRVMMALENEFGSVSSSSVFFGEGESMGRIGIPSSSAVWQKPPVKPSHPGLLFVGGFLIPHSSSFLFIGLFRFSISS